MTDEFVNDDRDDLPESTEVVDEEHDHETPGDLLELHEVLEWEKAVEEANK